MDQLTISGAPYTSTNGNSHALARMEPSACFAHSSRELGSRVAVRFRGDPLGVGLLAAGAVELAAGAWLARRARGLGGALHEAAAASVVHAGALVAGARRHDWRLPLLSTVIAGKVVGLLSRLETRTPVDAVWLLVLAQLRQQAARAEAWDASIAG